MSTLKNYNVLKKLKTNICTRLKFCFLNNVNSFIFVEHIVQTMKFSAQQKT